MKKLSLLLIAVFCCMALEAQKLQKSYKTDYLNRLYEYILDSLKADFLNMKTPCLEYEDPLVKDISTLRTMYQSEDGKLEVMSHLSDEACIVIWEQLWEDKLAAGVDFWYLSRDGVLKCLCACDTSGGQLSAKIETKSGKVYTVENSWGFLTIRENRITILDCFCETETADENGGLALTIIPFEGTNVFYWTLPSGEARLPLF